jgi:hypothetical protein
MLEARSHVLASPPLPPLRPPCPQYAKGFPHLSVELLHPPPAPPPPTANTWKDASLSMLLTWKLLLVVNVCACHVRVQPSTVSV